MNRITVGVVFGGRSVEHEISLISAKAIIKNLDPERFSVLPIFIEKGGAWRTARVDEWLAGGELFTGGILSPSLDPETPLFYEIEGTRIVARHTVDVMFPVLHGTNGEDGSVQGLFETMGVPYVGAPVLGSALGMDKIAQKAVFRQSGIPVVEHLWFTSSDWEKEGAKIRGRIVSEIGLPCFVKSANLGSSVGITKVRSEGEIDEAVRTASRYSTRIIVERAVEHPREIEISVLGNEDPITSLPGEIVPNREFYDYRAKYMEEGTRLIAPAKLDEETVCRLSELAIRSFRALDCAGMARVDFLVDPKAGEVFVSELNTIPGFTQISMYPKLWEVSGLSFRELAGRLVELALERKMARSRLETDFLGHTESKIAPCKD